MAATAIPDVLHQCPQDVYHEIALWTVEPFLQHELVDVLGYRLLLLIGGAVEQRVLALVFNPESLEAPQKASGRISFQDSFSAVRKTSK